MRNGVVDEMEYQRIKKEMNKASDYYSVEEISLMGGMTQWFYNANFIANNNSKKLTHF